MVSSCSGLDVARPSGFLLWGLVPRGSGMTKTGKVESQMNSFVYNY